MASLSLSLRLVKLDKFHADFRDQLIHAYLETVGKGAVEAFRAGSRASGGGRMGRYRAASRAGDWPAVQSGAMIGDFDYEVHGSDSVEIGSSLYYAPFVFNGTRRMAKRKGDNEALDAGIAAARAQFGDWLDWRRG